MCKFNLYLLYEEIILSCVFLYFFVSHRCSRLNPLNLQQCSLNLFGISSVTAVMSVVVVVCLAEFSLFCFDQNFEHYFRSPPSPPFDFLLSVFPLPSLHELLRILYFEFMFFFFSHIINLEPRPSVTHTAGVSITCCVQNEDLQAKDLQCIFPFEVVLKQLVHELI